jgi:hypothetical protein
MLPRLVARVEITNAQGEFDSQNPSPRAGDTLDSVRIAFTVEKSLEAVPNKATIRLWNLSRRTLDRIQGTVRKRIEWTPEEKAALLAAGASAQPVEITYDNAGLASIRLSWGYVGADSMTAFPPVSIGFIGASSRMREVTEGRDRILEIDAEDAGQLLGAGRSKKAFGPRTNVIAIIEELIHAIGLTVDTAKLENSLRSALLARGIPSTSLIQIGPYNCSGSPAATLLREIFGGLNIQWSVQDGEFLLLDQNTVLAGYEPLRLGGDSIFNQPQRLAANQMIVQTWASAEARPGRAVLFDADDIGAQYRIDRVKHDADTFSGGSSEVTLAAIQTIVGLF